MTTATESLTAVDWARAGLDVIGAGGVDAVKVEALARRLGVTKGSFYWHYRDRSALIVAALELWERAATADVIAGLRLIEDPAERLHALFTSSFGDDVDGLVDTALTARVDDPVVGPVVRRVSTTRITFLEELFADLGLTRSRAAAHARITYAAYVGHGQLRRTLPDDRTLATSNAAYLRHLLEVLTPE